MDYSNNNIQSVPASGIGKTRVFISYSRSDSYFVDELVSGLEWAGYEVTIDRESIVEGEEWKERLGALIADADTIVFVLSQAAVKSPVCAWEIDEAFRVAKRVLPVLIERTGDVAVPAKLSALNYVRFDPYDSGQPRSFMNGFRRLVNAIEVDIDWLREHSRYLARALEWDVAGRPNARLLRGPDITTAKEWVANRPKDAPESTELQHAFIEASEQIAAEQADTERQRLQEMAAAQTSKARALDDREKALKKATRRTFLGVAGTSIFAVGAGVAFGFKNLAESKAEKDRSEKEAAQEALINSKEQLAKWKQAITDDNNSLKLKTEGSPVEIIKTKPITDQNNHGIVSVSHAVKTVKADLSSYDGAGTVVAVIGPGIDFEHPTFRGMEFIIKDFTGEGSRGENAFGTSLTSVAVGKNVDNHRIGVAPGVKKVLLAKIIGSTGGGGEVSLIPMALDWIANYEGGVVDVVLIHVGMDFPSLASYLVANGNMTIENATALILNRYIQSVRTFESVVLAARLSGKGMIIVSPGGNESNGPAKRQPVTSPNAVAKGAISVGSSTSGEDGIEIANYSNSNVTICAPGVAVPAARQAGKLMDTSGTSVSAGIVAGTAALWWDYMRAQSSNNKVTADSVWAEIKKSSTIEGFASNVDEADRGLGLIQAPG